MRLQLGSVNLALISIYFIPFWGRDALRALISPYSGLDDRVHAAAASYFRHLFHLGTDGLVLTSHALAGVKLVIAAGFVAYAIEFARAWATGRDVDRETREVVLALAVIGMAIWALPALSLGETALIRLYATQMLLVAGGIIVITIELYIEQAPQPSRAATAISERKALQLTPLGAWATEPPPLWAAEAVARIPEARLRRT
jgi:hypothetical protein